MIALHLFTTPLQSFRTENSICLFKALTGQECYGCGIIRASAALLQCDLRSAIEFNASILFVFPLLCVVWLKYLFRLISNIIRINEHKI